MSETAPPKQEQELFPGADEKLREEVRQNAILEQKAAGAANKILASLPQMLDNAVKNEVKAQLSDAVEEIKKAILAGRAEMQAQAATTPQAVQPNQPQSPNLDALTTLAQAIVAIMGGNKPSGGIKDALGQIIEFQNMAAALWQQPFESAMRTLVTTLKGGYSVGKSTEELTDGLEHAVKEQKSAIDIFKVKPNAQPGP